MSVKRWRVMNGVFGEDAYEHTDGEYVLHTDHLAAVEEARKEAIDRLVQQAAISDSVHLSPEGIVVCTEDKWHERDKETARIAYAEGRRGAFADALENLHSCKDPENEFMVHLDVHFDWLKARAEGRGE